LALREYVCRRCGNVQTELFNGEYPENIKCEACGSRADYHIAPAAFRFDFKDGYDWGAGEYFNTARERDTYLDKKGLEKIG
jgi:DNA-directed RNA polymerase subunit RPC12/RpoP